MTTTDEILAIAASAGGTVSSSAGRAAEVTEADLAAFSEAAARGADSAVVSALLAIRPPSAQPVRLPAVLLPTVLGSASPSAARLGDPAWTAWLTAAAAMAATGMAAAGEATRTGTSRPAWCAVLAAATALAGPAADIPAGVAIPAAIAAGTSAATIIESGLADWGGWSSGTIAAAIGASVTAGLLLGLTQPQLRAALGICATQATGLRAAEATPAFALQVGKAAFNGVEAALLARAGLTAPGEPLDGRRGLFALFG
jgi:2-methylcitrate dehydratase PrpD